VPGWQRSGYKVLLPSSQLIGSAPWSVRCSRGQIGGHNGASGGLWLLAGASVEPGQGLYGRYSNRLVAHGKEKVYGSIP
jgi:hypothetical protein